MKSTRASRIVCQPSTFQEMTVSIAPSRTSSSRRRHMGPLELPRRAADLLDTDAEPLADVSERLIDLHDDSDEPEDSARTQAPLLVHEVLGSDELTDDRPVELRLDLDQLDLAPSGQVLAERLASVAADAVGELGEPDRVEPPRAPPALGTERRLDVNGTHVPCASDPSQVAAQHVVLARARLPLRMRSPHPFTYQPWRLLQASRCADAPSTRRSRTRP